MTAFVVDASVAVKWLVEEQQAADAAGLLDGEHELHAPHLMAAEVANALSRKARRGELDADEASTRMAAIELMPMNWVDDETLAVRAVRLAIELNHYAYDCMYLALAQQLGVQVATADIEFADLVAPTEHASAVIRLGDLGSE